MSHRSMAIYIAMVIRNAMEDFHVENLTDAQVRELNQLIRNAAYTALDSMHRAHTDKGAAAFLALTLRLIPGYWEEPELLSDYVASLKLHRVRPASRR